MFSNMCQGFSVKKIHQFTAEFINAAGLADNP